MNSTDTISMQKYHDKFIVSLILILHELSHDGKDTVRDNSKKMLDAILNKTITTENEGNIIKKVYSVLTSNVNYLKDRSTKLFNMKDRTNDKTVKITIIPAIDIGASWNLIDETVQDKIWIYLNSLYVNSTMMINCVNTPDGTNNVSCVDFFMENLNEDGIIKEFWVKYPDSTIISKNEFNPFVGVGANNADYGVSQILSGPSNIPDGASTSSDGMAQMLGLDKMLNMKELTENLKNISPGEIEKATQSIKSMLGNVDENTSQMIDIMLSDISNELKKEETTSGNPIDNIVKIAQTVAKGMMPKIDHGKIDMNKIWNQTKNMANNCSDGGINPLSMLTGFMEKQMGNKQLNKEDYMKECNNLIQSLNNQQKNKN